MNDTKQDNNQRNYLPICMCIGFVIGILVGYFVFGHAIYGSCAGIALGTFVSYAIPRK